MKKIIVSLLIIAAATQTLSAQLIDIRKNAWIDLQVAQHVGLNKWNSVGYANDGLPRAAITEFRGVFNLYLGRPVFGTFLDMGIGIMPAPRMRSFDLDRVPQPNEGTRYYLREMRSESGRGGTTEHFKITWGLFGNIRATDNLDIMPYFGIGGLSIRGREYDMILKEEGTNMQYRAKYYWGNDWYDDHDSYYDRHISNGSMLNYLTGRINFLYRLSSGMSLILGLEYTYFYETTYFSYRFTNTFNESVRKTVKYSGNKMNMLGISVGISFK